MMKSIGLVVALVGLPLAFTTPAQAGSKSGRHIEMCAEAVMDHAGIAVDEWGAEYTKGGLFSATYVEWDGIVCQPIKMLGVEVIHNLYVNGVDYIKDGYRGREAYDAAQTVEREVDGAIAELKKRIDLLENMRDRADDELRSDNPDAESVLNGVRRGIKKAVVKEH